MTASPANVKSMPSNRCQPSGTSNVPLLCNSTNSYSPPPDGLYMISVKRSGDPARPAWNKCSTSALHWPLCIERARTVVSAVSRMGDVYLSTPSATSAPLRWPSDSSALMSMSELPKPALRPWMARMLFPVFSLLMCLPTSKLTHVTADASSCWPVAPAFQAGLDAALALAMRVPLRYATKPSSYFMCNTMKLDFFRSAADTLNGIRTNTDWLTSFISASMSMPMCGS